MSRVPRPAHQAHPFSGGRAWRPWEPRLLEEVVVPILGRRLEADVMPALRLALFGRELEALGNLVRTTKLEGEGAQESLEKDWQELRNDVLHGQIDYRGDGPLPEHWKQYIDKEAALFDWRHPKWAQDAERIVIDLVVRAAEKEGWQGEIRPTSKTGAGLVELLFEVQEQVPSAGALAAKFLEGMPEWMQHDNAYTGGYLTEDDVAAMLAALEPKAAQMETSLKSGALLPGWITMLHEAVRHQVGLTWTVPMLRG